MTNHSTLPQEGPLNWQTKIDYTVASDPLHTNTSCKCNKIKTNFKMHDKDKRKKYYFTQTTFGVYILMKVKD